MSNKIVTRKIINAIFLAMVLITGTITAIYPSFIIGVQAQGDPYHQMYNRYNSYEQQSREYPPKYADREYNSYKPSYEKDSYDTPPSYRNDNYQPREYSSYQQDYKQEYPKYVKDNNSYKSKKDSVSMNKLNCINNNVNINGNNTGDINIGNKGAAKGFLGGYSSAGSGYSGEGYSGYDNGHIKKDKGFDCVINNNNTNTNIASSGNQTKPTCEECFTTNLNATEINRLLSATVLFSTLEQLCDFIDENFQNATQRQFISSYLLNAALSAGISTDKINDILGCLEEIYNVVFPRTIDRDTLLQVHYQYHHHNTQ